MVSEGSDTLTKLLHPLLKHDVHIDHELQIELIKTVFFYLSSHKESKTTIGQNHIITKTLMSYLKQGSHETRRDAAANFALLSSSDSNRKFILNAGVLVLLIDRLAENEASAFNAISNLCLLEENRDRL